METTFERVYPETFWKQRQLHEQWCQGEKEGKVHLLTLVVFLRNSTEI